MADEKDKIDKVSLTTLIERITSVVEEAEQAAINAEVRLGDAKREAERSYQQSKRARELLHELKDQINGD